METLICQKVKKLQLKIVSAKLGCAEEELKKDPNYIFRLILKIKKINNKIETQTILSKKVKLSKTSMEFDEKSDILEITMGVGNSIGGYKYPSDCIYIKNLSVYNECESKWDLCMNSHVIVKYRIFDEDLSKLNSKKHSSNYKIDSSNDSLTWSHEKSTTIENISNKDKKDIYSEAPFELKQSNPESRISSLLNIFNKPTTNQRNSNLEDKPKNQIIQDSVSMFEKSINLTLDNRTTLDTISVGSTIENPIKKRSKIVAPSHNKEKYRKEMSILYSDAKEFEIELDKNGDSTSTKIIEKYFPNSSIYSKNEYSSAILDNQCNKIINNETKVITEPKEKLQTPSRNSNIVSSLISMISSNAKTEIDPNIQNRNLKGSSTLLSYKNDLLDNEGFLKCDEINLNDLNFADSFCEAFFLTGLPEINAHALDDTEDHLATCRHPDCSKLLAYKPEIISRFPVKDTSRLELNSLLASICFPLGVKLCYSMKEAEILTLKNYSTSIINQDGSRFHLITYQFFIKYDNYTFQNTYQINPAKEFLHLEKLSLLMNNNNPEIKKNLELKLEHQLELCTKFNFNEFVYVPFVACLISKNPYISQMEKCLQVIVQMLVSDKPNEEEIKKLIIHLTREVPLPPIDKKLSFLIPMCPHPITITSVNYKDLPVINGKLNCILESFSIENILIIFNLILLEQKILFIGNEHWKTSEVIDSFTSLLYPFQWIHTYIPILSQEMLKYLQSFMPFIMGLDESLLDFAKPYFTEEDNIYFVFISKDKVDISSNRKGKKLKRKELLKIPDFPSDLEKYLTQRLTDLKKAIDKNSKNKDILDYVSIEICLRDIFVKCFIKMFGDYSKYCAIIDDVPVFNTESFVLNRSERDAKFYSELTETQLFNLFLQTDVKENFPFFFKLNENPKIRSNSLTKRSISVSIQEDRDIEYKKLILKTSSQEKVIKNNPLINSYSLKEIIETYKNSENIRMPPYFICNKIFNCTENTYKDEYILPVNKRIFKCILFLNFSELPSTVRRGIINEYKKTQNINYERMISSSVLAKVSNFQQKADQIKKNKFFFKSDKSEILSQSEKDEVKNVVNEYLRLILSSEKLSHEKKKVFHNILKKSYGREIFSRGIFQTKFKEKREHCLSKESFEDLFEFIFQALLSEADDPSNFIKVNLNNLRVNGKSNHYIYQEFRNKKGVFSFKNEKFWHNWLVAEKKENDSGNLSKDENYYSHILKMSNIMMILNFDLKFVLNILVDKLAREFITSDKLIEELKISLLKQSKNFLKI